MTRVSDLNPRAITAFCVLWAATELFDLVCFPDWITEPAGIGLFLASIGVLLKPSSIGRFLLLCALDVAYLWVKSPWTPNHFLFKGLVCLSILVVALPQVWRGWAALERAQSEAAAILRLEVCALYLLSFLHKLNSDFLNPSISCAGFMLGGLADRLPFVPTGGLVNVVAMWSTLLIEGGIPVLVLIPRTRRLGLLVAWAFHFLLSFHPRPGIYAFSAMLFALLSLFLPFDFYTKLEAEVARHPRLNALRDFRWMRPLLIVGVVGAVCVGLLILVRGVNLHGTGISEWPRMAGMLIWIPYAIVLLIALWVGWTGAPARSAMFRDALRSPALAVVGLILLNGMAPYLGFQTVRVLSMFSNLRTEGGVSNHMLIPIGWQTAGYQTDLVEIVSSSEPVLQFYAEARQWIPFAEVRRRIWDQSAPTRVTFIRSGRTYSVNTSEREAAQQVPPLDFLSRKFLAFRGINMNGSAECLW